MADPEIGNFTYVGNGSIKLVGVTIAYTTISNDFVIPFQKRYLNVSNPVNKDHFLNRNREAWWLVLPHLYGGNTFYNIAQQNYNLSITYSDGDTFSASKTETITQTSNSTNQSYQLSENNILNPGDTTGSVSIDDVEVVTFTIDIDNSLILTLVGSPSLYPTSGSLTDDILNISYTGDPGTDSATDETQTSSGATSTIQFQLDFNNISNGSLSGTIKIGSTSVATFTTDSSNVVSLTKIGTPTIFVNSASLDAENGILTVDYVSAYTGITYDYFHINDNVNTTILVSPTSPAPYLETRMAPIVGGGISVFLLKILLFSGNPPFVRSENDVYASATFDDTEDYSDGSVTTYNGAGPGFKTGDPPTYNVSTNVITMNFQATASHPEDPPGDVWGVLIYTSEDSNNTQPAAPGETSITVSYDYPAVHDYAVESTYSYTGDIKVWNPSTKGFGYGEIRDIGLNGGASLIPSGNAITSNDITFSIWAIYPNEKYDGSSDVDSYEKLKTTTTSPGWQIVAYRSTASETILYVLFDAEDSMIFCTINDNNWHHICVVVDRTNYLSSKIYIDAIDSGSLDSAIAPSTFADNTARYDDESIYSRQLSASEVQALYLESKSGYLKTLNWVPLESLNSIIYQEPIPSAVMIQWWMFAEDDVFVDSTTNLSYTSTGSLLLYGNAGTTNGLNLSYTPTGSLLLYGSTVVGSQQIFYTSSGKLLLSGSATSSVNLNVVSSGKLITRIESFQDTVTRLAPIAWWRFEDGSGTVCANSGSIGSAVDATYPSGANLNNKTLVPSEINLQSVRFTTSQCISVPDHAQINTGGPYTVRTVALWFRASTVNTRQVLYEEGDETRGLNIYIDTGHLWCNIWNKSADGPDASWGPLGIDTDITSNTTYYVVLVYNKPSVKMFVNGVSIRTLNTAGTLYAHSGNIAIGGVLDGTSFQTSSTTGNGYYFVGGKIDEVALYDYALTANDVKQTYETSTARYAYFGDLYDYVAEGNLSLTGSATVHVTKSDWSYTSTGSLTLAGGIPNKFYQTTGNLVLTGNAQNVMHLIHMPIGGLVLSGSAAVERNVYGYASNGKLILSGNATTIPNYNFIATGELLINGSSPHHTQGQYTSTGGLTLSGSANAIISEFAFDTEFLWNVVQEFVIDTEFSWNILQGKLRAYQVKTKCRDASVCPPVQIDDSACTSGTYTLTTVIAHDVTEVCRKIKKQGIVGPIESIKQYSLPLIKSEFSETDDPNCNKLIDVTPTCQNDDCCDLIIDISYIQPLGGYGTAEIVNNYIANGSLKVSGNAIVRSNMGWTYATTGKLHINGSSIVNTPGWEGIIVSNGGGEGAIVEQKEIVPFLATETSITPNNDLIITSCFTSGINPKIQISTDIFKNDVFSAFAKRNNITKPGVINMTYSRMSGLWQSNLHYSGIGLQALTEKWNISMELGCVSTNISLPQLKFLINIRRIEQYALNNIVDFDSKIIVFFDANTVVGQSSPFNFNFSVNLNTKDTSPASKNVIIYDDGIFANQKRLNDPRVQFNIGNKVQKITVGTTQTIPI